MPLCVDEMANSVSSHACSTTIIVGVYAIIFGLGKLCGLIERVIMDMANA